MRTAPVKSARLMRPNSCSTVSGTPHGRDLPMALFNFLNEVDSAKSALRAKIEALTQLVVKPNITQTVSNLKSPYASHRNSLRSHESVTLVPPVARSPSSRHSSIGGHAHAPISRNSSHRSSSRCSVEYHPVHPHNLSTNRGSHLEGAVSMDGYGGCHQSDDTVVDPVSGWVVPGRAEFPPSDPNQYRRGFWLQSVERGCASVEERTQGVFAQSQCYSFDARGADPQPSLSLPNSHIGTPHRSPYGSQAVVRQSSYQSQTSRHSALTSYQTEAPYTPPPHTLDYTHSLDYTRQASPRREVPIIRVETQDTMADRVSSEPVDYSPVSRDRSPESERQATEEDAAAMWSLRLQMEEEEDVQEPHHYPEQVDQLLVDIYKTSIDSSNSENNEELSPGNRAAPARRHPPRSPLLHPNYETRRQSYQRFVTNRVGPERYETSFSSLETDAEVPSDASRCEATTTSFDSNTDGCVESGSESQQSVRLSQFKVDSGYRSVSLDVERAGNSPTDSVQPPRLHVTPTREHISPGTSSPQLLSPQYRAPATSAATEKRRYSMQRQKTVEDENYDTCPSPVALRTPTQSPLARSPAEHVDPGDHLSADRPSTSQVAKQDSFDDPTPYYMTKPSVFARLLKRPSSRFHPMVTRDYSIDERTNSIFNEFVRYDPDLERDQDHARRRLRYRDFDRSFSRDSDPIGPRQHSIPEESEPQATA